LPTAEFSLPRTVGNKDAAAEEIVHFKDRIMQYDRQGVAWWNFVFTDRHAQERGIQLTVEAGNLPQMKLEFCCPPDAKHRPDVFLTHVTAYWTPGGRWFDQESLKPANGPVFRDLIQVVVIEAPSKTTQTHLFANRKYTFSPGSLTACTGKRKDQTYGDEVLAEYFLLPALDGLGQASGKPLIVERKYSRSRTGQIVEGISIGELEQ
jgi:hypothetical protein